MGGGNGGYIPSNIWQGGMAYVIIPLILWIVNNILTYLYKKSAQINRFCSKNGRFLMILAKFYQKFLQKCKIWISQAQRIFLHIACSKFALKSIHQIARFQFQKYKIFQLLRGAHPPSDTPWCATKSSPPILKMDLCPWPISIWYQKKNPTSPPHFYFGTGIWCEASNLGAWVINWTQIWILQQNVTLRTTLEAMVPRDLFTNTC